MEFPCWSTEMTMLYRPHENQSTVELFGVDASTTELIGRRLAPGTVLRTNSIEDGELPASVAANGVDAVLLGLQLENPVRLAQRIHAFDRQIPVLILADATRNDQLRRTLMFSPFLGSEVKVWPADKIDELPTAIAEAVERRRQRKRYHETVANAEIRLEVLPMLQPDATHYLDQLLEHLPIGVVTVDLAGTVLTLNNQARTVLGVDERSALGATFAEFFPTTEKARLCNLIRGCTEANKKPPPEIVEIPTEGGHRTRFLEVTAAALAYRTGQRGVMLMLQDVTAQIEVEKERKRAEDELRLHATVLRAFHEISSTPGQELKHKVHRLLELGREQFGMPIGLLTHVDEDGLIILDSIADDSCFAAGSRLPLDQTFCSAAVASMEPIAVEHAKITEWRLHPSYTAGEKTRLEAYLGTRVQVNGTVFGTLCFSSRLPREKPFNSAACEILKLMSQWLGSELQREYAEADMRKLSGAVEQTADSVIITNRDLVIEYVNASFENLTGYTKNEVVGTKAVFNQSSPTDAKFTRSLRRKLETEGVFQGTLTGRKKDGTVFHEQKTISPLRDREGKTTHYIATGRDITELIKAQENDRLHQAELAHVARLSTLGEMTSGLAHELNQPLCAITTYAQTCLRIIQGRDTDLEHLRYGLDKIVAQAELGGKIFRRLRDFARKGITDRQNVDVAEIINEVVGFIGWEVQHKLIRVKLDLARDLPMVRVDPIQIEQVLLNLVRNSIDAIASLDETRRHILIRTTLERRQIVVAINDGGCGCAPSQADRLFEPFYTTKPEGLGIGLTVSQSLIEAHGGRLWLKANSRRGATFCFTLPISETMT